MPDRSADWIAACTRLALVWAGLIALFAPQWRSMADQWWNISTYNHVLLVPAILLWLVAQRWPQLRALRPGIWWPALAGVAAAATLFVLGHFAGFAGAEQAGSVALLVAVVPLLLGVRVAAGLVFPLCYMAFLVPFGDELVPALQLLTARMTVALLHFSHIPAHLDGVFITTRAGLFEIAEACSGVKFLTAMVAFGVLAAHVGFRSWRRRLGFVALCVVVPVLANGVRAWATVAVAQVKGAAWAGGFDHIVYGWVFFAVVIAAIIGGAWRWFDRPAADPMIDAGAIAASPLLARYERLSLSPALAVALLAVLVLGAQDWTRSADRLAAPLPAQIALPQVPGWHRVPYRPRVWWEPRAGGADHRLLGRYADGAGHQVDVFFALYASQGPGKKAGGYGEGALWPDHGWAWQSAGPAPADALGERLLAAGPVARLAQTSLHSGPLTTGSTARLRLAGIADRLALRARPTMMLILSGEAVPAQPAPEASIAAFRAAIGPAGPWMDAIAVGR